VIFRVFFLDGDLQSCVILETKVYSLYFHLNTPETGGSMALIPCDCRDTVVKVETRL
jgi:hypothetical protein